jgi:hypothetical protein
VQRPRDPWSWLFVTSYFLPAQMQLRGFCLDFFLRLSAKKAQLSERMAGGLRPSGMTPGGRVLKAAVLAIAGFCFSVGAGLHGQSITGTWQGTLSAKESQRIVLKFAKPEDNGSLHGSLIFIDRGPSGPPLLSVTFAPPDLDVAVGDIRYRGKLSADGKSITGV